MTHILFLIFSASTASGPTHVGMHSMEFATREACVAAAKEAEDLTRTYRVSWSKMDWKCLPKGNAPTEPSGAR
jgi:hypothetical protein